jgi:hypothetical protein
MWIVYFIASSGRNLFDACFVQDYDAYAHRDTYNKPFTTHKPFEVIYWPI